MATKARRCAYCGSKKEPLKKITIRFRNGKGEAVKVNLYCEGKKCATFDRQALDRTY